MFRSSSNYENFDPNKTYKGIVKFVYTIMSVVAFLCFICDILDKAGLLDDIVDIFIKRFKISKKQDKLKGGKSSEVSNKTSKLTKIKNLLSVADTAAIYKSKATRKINEAKENSKYIKIADF